MVDKDPQNLQKMLNNLKAKAAALKEEAAQQLTDAREKLEWLEGIAAELSDLEDNVSVTGKQSVKRQAAYLAPLRLAGVVKTDNIG
jgi:Skp family chaperone for outer membrane proteins